MTPTMDQVVSRFEVVRKALSNFKLRSRIRREETIVRPMSGSGYGSVDEVHIKGDRGNSCSVIQYHLMYGLRTSRSLTVTGAIAPSRSSASYESS